MRRMFPDLIRVDPSHPCHPWPPLFFLLLAVYPARAQARFDELEKVALEELKETGTPGAALAVVSGDRVVYARGFGVASVETGTPVTPEMLFRLGSTTKMFTGAALVKLAEAGKIKLDAPLGDAVTGLHPALARLTPHQLLSNSSGLRDFAPPFVSHDDAALSRMVREWKEEVFFGEPGQIYSYSSAGFWLSGYVVEELTKRPYADAMSELLFEPLGMARTTFRPHLAMTYPLALGHAAEGQGPAAVIRPAFNNVAMWPAGSIFSSARDLSRFVIAFLNGGRVDGRQVLSPTLISRLQARHVMIPGGGDTHYGYGLLNFTYRGVRVVMHGGFSRGYGSMIQMAPERRFAVIALTNRSGVTLGRTVGRAMELGLELGAEAAARTAPPALLTESEVADFAGVYLHEPMRWEIFAREGRLHLRQEGREFPLTRTGARQFSFGPGGESEIVLIPGPGGKVEYLFSNIYAARKVTGRG